MSGEQGGRGGRGPPPDLGIPIPALPPTCWVTLGNSLNLSGPHFIHSMAFIERLLCAEHCTKRLESTIGGKFGEVCTCTEKATGLKLAAKIIKKQSAKDKDMVLLEIEVMNLLNHQNLIQLYAAIESPHHIILFMEFIEGGELFERIVDEDYQLTEVDTMVFVRQICDGVLFMHKMMVLHLDLKPENILCVSSTGHMVKIIDFGLARRYNPKEKLQVNFGTPEFLSPEVVNYDRISEKTDMWSVGVITYMLLSGLSPFLGDNDTETLNNVLAANWYFDEETFEMVSPEAKDFVSHLIVKDQRSAPTLRRLPPPLTLLFTERLLRADPWAKHLGEDRRVYGHHPYPQETHKRSVAQRCDCVPSTVLSAWESPVA
uniref:Myosin light chain kinase 2 n=1 Tax=Ornithorhynchus anatinus TaxID=9258 RepID=A0A6I8NEF1_ORNAN